MEIVDNTFSVSNYEDFLNKNLDLEDIKKGFKEAKVAYYEGRIALWRKLKESLESSGTIARSITSENGVLAKGCEITSLVLGEALEYFCRSFYNFYAQDKLIEYRYPTWSGVTNYYSSFFCIHSLLRLQGRCITAIWRPMGKKFYIFPYSFLDHEYVICTNGVRGKTAHDAAWWLYYEIYDGFEYPDNLNFESIFKRKYVGTVEEEIDFRNQINYEPYQGYDEIRDPNLIPSIIEKYESKKFTRNEIELLSRLTTDPDYRYYARSVLRLIFCYTLITELASENNELVSLIGNQKADLSSFLRQAKPRNDENMLCRRLQKLMGLETSSVNTG